MHVIHFRVHAPLLAVGSDDPNTNAGGKVQIHGYNEASRFVYFLYKKHVVIILIFKFKSCSFPSCNLKLVLTMHIYLNVNANLFSV